MPNSSPLSRILLGASLTIAVAVIIMVASSRPSISKQETRLPVPQGDDHDSHSETASTPVQRSVPDDQPADDSERDVPEKTVDLPSGKEPSPSGSSPTATVESHPVNDGDTPVTDQVAMPRVSGGKVRPLEPAEQISDKAERDAALRESAEPAQKEQAREQPAKQRPEKNQRSDRADPLKRLSLEFARRAAARGGARAKATPVAPPAHEIFPPSVVMSDEHRKSCVVFVGDSMPVGKLKDNAGQVHSIRQSLGKRLTAIVFWNVKNPYAFDQFEELQNDLVPFKQLEVQTIAVHVGPVPKNYAELCQQFGQDVLCLADPDEAYFLKVATGRIPRTYLLDADGKIIWLDIEYSRTTRYELRNALHFSLREK